MPAKFTGRMICITTIDASHRPLSMASARAGTYIALRRTATGGPTVLELNVNGTTHAVDADPEMPLLWVLRDLIGLTGTKYGCGVALCGACTVHIDGVPTRSCVLPAGDAVGASITTIEGLGGKAGEAVQTAWQQLDVVQCGYCQSGQIMAAAALLAESPKPTDSDIDAALTNICRCATYQRIRAAVHEAARLMEA
jgi:isoquinoline 1-oxidoreductase alpha subunit